MYLPYFFSSPLRQYNNNKNFGQSVCSQVKANHAARQKWLDIKQF